MYKRQAQICIGIIRHYTQGWADGFTFDVPYWEIWNEPDNNLTKPDMWIGEPDTYYRLYETAAKVIKAAFPSIKVGGYAGSVSYTHLDVYKRQIICGVEAISSAGRIGSNMCSIEKRITCEKSMEGSKNAAAL